MAIRRDPIYLSYGTWRALKLIGKARSDEGNIVTADQLADEMLQALLKEKYPQLTEHQKKVEKLERDLIKSLNETTVAY